MRLLDSDWWRENFGSGDWIKALRGDDTVSADNEIGTATQTEAAAGRC